MGQKSTKQVLKNPSCASQNFGTYKKVNHTSFQVKHSLDTRNQAVTKNFEIKGKQTSFDKSVKFGTYRKVNHKSFKVNHSLDTRNQAVTKTLGQKSTIQF